MKKFRSLLLPMNLPLHNLDFFPNASCLRLKITRPKNVSDSIAYLRSFMTKFALCIKSAKIKKEISELNDKLFKYQSDVSTAPHGQSHENAKNPHIIALNDVVLAGSKVIKQSQENKIEQPKSKLRSTLETSAQDIKMFESEIKQFLEELDMLERFDIKSTLGYKLS
jgi:hypothetical protein